MQAESILSLQGSQVLHGWAGGKSDPCEVIPIAVRDLEQDRLQVQQRGGSLAGLDVSRPASYQSQASSDVACMYSIP